MKLLHRCHAARLRAPTYVARVCIMHVSQADGKKDTHTHTHAQTDSYHTPHVCPALVPLGWQPTADHWVANVPRSSWETARSTFPTFPSLQNSLCKIKKKFSTRLRLTRPTESRVGRLWKCECSAAAGRNEKWKSVTCCVHSAWARKKNKKKHTPREAVSPSLPSLTALSAKLTAPCCCGNMIPIITAEILSLWLH